MSKWDDFIRDRANRKRAGAPVSKRSLPPYDEDRRKSDMHRRAVQSPALEKAIDQAAQGATKALTVYLRSGGTITEPRHLDALADLIERRHRVGTPKDPSPRAEIKRLLVGMVRYQERLWRRRHPGKPLKRGKRNEFIEEAKHFIAEQGPNVADISTDEIRAELGRGRVSR